AARMLPLCLLMFAGIPSLSAEGKGADGSEPPEVIPNANLELWRQFATVIVVLILVIGLILLIVKIISKNDLPWIKNKAIRSLGGVQLGQHKSIQVIDLGEVIYVVGVGENIQLVDKIHEAGMMETIRSRFEVNRFS